MHFDAVKQKRANHIYDTTFARITVIHYSQLTIMLLKFASKCSLPTCNLHTDRAGILSQTSSNVGKIDGWVCKWCLRNGKNNNAEIRQTFIYSFGRRAHNCANNASNANSSGADCSSTFSIARFSFAFIANTLTWYAMRCRTRTM